MLTSRVPLQHVSSVPPVVPGSAVLVVEWHDGRESHTMHVHCRAADVNDAMLADLEAFGRRRGRPVTPRLTLLG
jgi:hypothetical protein